MCLERVDTKPKRKQGIGYKVVKKKNGKYYSWDYPQTAGKVEYPLNEWITDTNTGVIGRAFSYPAGFHVALSLAKCESTLREFNSRNSYLLALIKVKFKNVVATGSDGNYGKQVVAIEIMNLGEVERIKC